MLALLLAMLTNWLRIFIIVLAGHLSDMQHHLVTDEHYSFGWYMFAGMMVLFFLVVRRWPAGAAPAAPGATPTGCVVPVQRIAAGAARDLRWCPCGMGWMRIAPDPERLDAFLPPQPCAPRPRAARRCTGSRDSRARIARSSARGDGVTSYAAIYAEQHQGKEVIYFGNSILGPGLRRAGSSAAQPAGRWMEQRAASTDGRVWLIWYAYRMDDRWYRSALRLQLAYGFDSLVDKPVVALIALRAACAGGDCDAARAGLESYSETHYP